MLKVGNESYFGLCKFEPLRLNIVFGVSFCKCTAFFFLKYLCVLVHRFGKLRSKKATFTTLLRHPFITINEEKVAF